MAALPEPSTPTVTAIFAAYEADAWNGASYGIGAAALGEDCERRLWYDFRWATKLRHTGRMLRLFETGDLGEARLIANLRRIGVTVLDRNPDTNKQWRFEALGGHLVCKIDASAIGLPEAPKTWHLCEFKTHNAKSFKGIASKGLQFSKPSHWIQCQLGMHLAGLDRCFYLAVNKDTDELYQERVKHDEAAAIRLVEKARRVIFAARPPVRISEDPGSYLCRFCAHHPICHGREKLPEMNCRTCLHSTPLEEGGWHCARWNKTLDIDEQKAGCPHQLFHPDLVPGEQTDAGPDFVEYRMDDGSTWRDGFSPVECPVDEVPV